MTATDVISTEPPHEIRVTFSRVLVSEWRKMVTLRSTWWTIGIGIALHAGVGLLMAVYTRARGSSESPAETVNWAIGATQLTQLAVIVLAVMFITSEYATGQIRISATAVPTRLPILAAKTLVLAGVVLVMGIVATVLSLATALAVAGNKVAFGLPGPETARLLVAAPLYLVGIAVLSFAIGALIRSTGGTIATMMALLLVVEQMLFAIPFHLTKIIAPWLPGNAGSLILCDHEQLDMLRDMVDPGVYLGPWWGYVVLLGWGVLFLALAGLRLRARDI